MATLTRTTSQVLAHRDDAVAQTSAKAARSGPDGTMQPILATADDAVTAVAGRSTSFRMAESLSGAWRGMIGGAATNPERG